MIAVAQPATVCAPAFSNTDWSAPPVNAGTSLTGATAIWNVCGGLVSLPPSAVPPSSTARTVTVAAPDAFAAGV